MSDRRAAALTYLQSHNVMTLATNGPQGVWAAAVFYANEGFDLYFLSAGHTRHAQDVAASGQAAAAIHEDYREWTEIKGIQLEGHVALLEGEEKVDAVSLYQTKYPFVSFEDNAQMRVAMAKVNWYRLRPHQLYFIDNSLGLGHRDKISLA